MLGKRHPDALGKPARELWTEIWPVIGADVENVIRHGQPIFKERERLVLECNGYPEETFFTYSHTPFRTIKAASVDYFRFAPMRPAGCWPARTGQADRATQGRRSPRRTILESITDAFFSVDRDWRFDYVNQQAERVLGRVPGDLVGKVLWEVYPGLVGSEFERAYRRTAEEASRDFIHIVLPGS